MGKGRLGLGMLTIREAEVLFYKKMKDRLNPMLRIIFPWGGPRSYNPSIEHIINPVIAWVVNKKTGVYDTPYVLSKTTKKDGVLAWDWVNMLRKEK